jgi:hypothetical protein
MMIETLDVSALQRELEKLNAVIRIKTELRDAVAVLLAHYIAADSDTAYDITRAAADKPKVPQARTKKTKRPAMLYFTPARASTLTSDIPAEEWRHLSCPELLWRVFIHLPDAGINLTELVKQVYHMSGGCVTKGKVERQRLRKNLCTSLVNNARMRKLYSFNKETGIYTKRHIPLKDYRELFLK